MKTTMDKFNELADNIEEMHYLAQQLLGQMNELYDNIPPDDAEAIYEDVREIISTLKMVKQKAKNICKRG